MILALDISLVTGFAIGTGGQLAFGTRDFSGFNSDYALVGLRFHQWLIGLLTQYEPTDVAIEKPFLRNEGTSYLLGGLVWEAHRAAQLRNIPRFEYPPITIKKFMTGDHRAKKDAMIRASLAKGYNVQNDHEADAVAIHLLHQSKVSCETKCKVI